MQERLNKEKSSSLILIHTDLPSILFYPKTISILTNNFMVFFQSIISQRLNVLQMGRKIVVCMYVGTLPSMKIIFVAPPPVAQTFIRHWINAPLLKKLQPSACFLLLYVVKDENNTMVWNIQYWRAPLYAHCTSHDENLCLLKFCSLWKYTYRYLLIKKEGFF